MSKKTGFSKILLAVVILVIIVAVSIAAGLYYSNRSNTKPPIVLGVLTPLSPPADYISGRQILVTAQIFANYTNSHGGLLGRKVVVVSQNENLDPSQAIASLQQMVTQDHIVGLIGPWESLVALPVANATQSYPVITFFTYSWSDAITANHYKYVFRVGVFNSIIGAQLAKYLEWANISNNIVILAEQSPFGIGFAQALNQSIHSYNQSAIVNTYYTPPGITDYTSVLLKINSLTPTPKALVVALNVPGVITANKEIYDMGLQNKMKVVQAVDWPTYDGGVSWWQAVGQAGVGGVYASYAPPHLKVYTDSGQYYVQQFEKIEGHPPAFWLIWYWDCLRIWAQAIQATGSTNPDVLANYIANINITASTGGYITFINNPTPGSPYWHQWVGYQQYIYQFTQYNQSTADTQCIYPPNAC
ncbi:hypothetical protein B9Q02_06550 [Candidatus Marsarchaeota G1 archaeon BE_D]|jgi:branched-chain amino acid transport system substrate-binding protein|uniref:Leucine-binding protein domain-containing protein n=1 Tax=Candidatus Marsarchaeota G1 archaeon BE_D TaxID=1978156 RepID=A0A2R6AG98_9ARCH|nr:MAG: hypothetical protein B9Q02_06550 [Candidatus Marsarchaeota G1 archaeon BE_D]